MSLRRQLGHPLWIFRSPKNCGFSDREFDMIIFVKILYSGKQLVDGITTHLVVFSRKNVENQ